jgi:hypothetical protein
MRGSSAIRTLAGNGVLGSRIGSFFRLDDGLRAIRQLTVAGNPG